MDEKQLKEFISRMDKQNEELEKISKMMEKLDRSLKLIADVLRRIK